MSLSPYIAQFLPTIEAEMRRSVTAPDDPALTAFSGMQHIISVGSSAVQTYAG
jgi:hypothetical protein